MGKPQLIVITGPTATGKSTLALELAIRYNAEIVSADSRQVYRYLDIGTAKPTAHEQAQVPHHIIDVVNPDGQFDTARFRTLAHEAIHDIIQRGKRVLVVGGTGLYIRTLVRGLFSGPQADPTLRRHLETQEKEQGRGFLHAWLRKIDPDAAQRLHPNDTIRLIRALEVWLLSGKPMSVWQREHGFQECPFSTLILALAVERETLAQRIERRCQAMVRAGLVDEVRRVWDMGYDVNLSVLHTIGYAQVGLMLNGHYTLAEAVAQMAKETRRLAKRQLTWFRTEPGVRWFLPGQAREIDTAIKEFLRVF